MLRVTQQFWAEPKGFAATLPQVLGHRGAGVCAGMCRWQPLRVEQQDREDGRGLWVQKM